MPDFARCFTAVLTASSLLAACDSSAAEKSSKSVVTDSAGVAILTGPADDAALGWTLTEAFRIGGADSGPGSFGGVSARYASTDDSGNIYVLDSEQHRVEVFDSTGAHVRFLGARGGGPGEFEDVAGLIVLPSGDVAVADYGKRALVRWRADGSLLSEHALQNLSLSEPLWLSGDTLIHVVQEYGERERTQALQIRTSGDTITTPALASATSGMVNFTCIGLNLPPMFSPQLLWTGDGRRQAVTHQVPYRVDIYEGGALVRSVRRSLTPVAPGAAHVERMFPDGGMKIQFPGGACTVPISELLDKQGVAAQLPMIDALRFDAEGRLWVQRYGIRDEPRNVDVFAASGEYLGTLADRSVPLGFIGDDIVLFAESDRETGLSNVVAYRVRRVTEQ